MFLVFEIPKNIFTNFKFYRIEKTILVFVNMYTYVLIIRNLVQRVQNVQVEGN